MLKITKKIKKKHKHKRGKEEELFTPEELERYKQQQAEKAQQAAAAAAAEALDEAAGGSSGFVAGDGGDEAGEAATGGGGFEEGSEEWQRFKALTAGVDDILKKSQGDLGRIKSTSFFQRKPPGFTEPDKEKKKRPERPAAPVVPDKRWVGFEEGARAQNQEEQESHPVQQEEVVQEVPVETFPEEEEEEDLEPEDDGLFDTSYVDVVTSGDIKLAYIPDSPPPEEEEGDDPFDTSIVDKVIKPTEIITKDGKKKTLVSLGCAVDVLTGRLDKAIPQTIVAPGTKKRRVQPRDLLFDDANAEAQSDLSPPELTSVNAPKSLLDDDSESIPDDLPVNVTVPVAVTPQPILEVYKKEDTKSDLKNLVAEFDLINTTEQVETVVSEESDDEFAALAAESVSKSYDPFDTSVAEVALGEVTKQKFPGSPDVDVLLRSDSPSWDGTETLQKQPPRPPPPRPQPISSGAEVDPFDTSFAENLVPGRVELQLIENEILGGVTTSAQDDDDDFDFDPRAGEAQNKVTAPVISSVTIHVSAPLDEVEEEESEEGEQEQEDIPEPVALQPAHRDLLGGSSTDLSTLAHDPIEPDVETEFDVGAEDFDPFDTSVVTVLAPGKAELRVLEEELLTQPAAGTVDLSDDEFDPRGGNDTKPDLLPTGHSGTINSTANITSPSSRPDLLGEGGENDKPPIFKPLTPLPGNQNDVSPGDPFDTTFAENIAPGKAELRLIESELVLKRSLSDEDFNPRDDTSAAATVSRRYSEVPSVLQVIATSGRRFSDVTGDHKQLPPSSLPLQRVASPPPDRPDLLAVAEEDEEAPHKPLTPAQESARPLAQPDDPFDTSQVSPALAPGPAELRQLENELRIDEPPAHLTRSYTDEDFNPRDAPGATPAAQQLPTEKPDLLHLPDEAGDDFKPLSPQLDEDDNRDPFDTSFAGDLLPGRAELKLLEAELIG